MILREGTLWGLIGVRKGIGGATTMRTHRGMAPMMAFRCTLLRQYLSRPAGMWESLTCLTTPGMGSASHQRSMSSCKQAVSASELADTKSFTSECVAH